MTTKISVSPEHFSLVKKILSNYLDEHYKVWVFGSRITIKHREYSDLDLAIERYDKKNIDSGILVDIKNAFQDSDLPWEVDVVDLCDLSDEFKNIVENNRVQIDFNK